MNSDPSSIYMTIFTLSILSIIYGFLVCYGVALDNSSKTKIKSIWEDTQSKKALIALELLKRPLRQLITLRLINIFIVIASVRIILLLQFNPYISLGIYGAILIAFCELLPSKIAIQHKEEITIRFANLQQFISRILYPIYIILRTFANIFLRIFKQDTDIDGGSFSEEEVMSMLEVGRESGVLKEEGQKMINSIFNFDDELAYEIMTPRTDVFTIDIQDPTSEYLEKLMELRYSRIPVYEKDYDNIIGILHIKDYLIKARESGFDNVDIRSILRKPYFVPETKNIDALFFELQKEKQHIAILIDEYGGFSGIVTMEDIVEEIVGEIDDEYDEVGHVIEKIDDFNYSVDGNVYLSDLSEESNINLESESSETIGGFIIDILGEIPDEKDINKEINFEQYSFTILSVKDRRIEKVMIHIDQNQEDQEEEEE